MSASYKILFPVETAARELTYKLALSAKLAECGHECYIGSKHEIAGLFSLVKPFVYFDKGYHAKVSETIYTEVKGNGGIIINLDEEGGVDFKHSPTIAARYPDELFEWCDLIFLWGEAQFRLLKEKRVNFNEEKVVISGHPRFELLKPTYHCLYRHDIEKIRRRFGNYILINTNMGFGNNIRGDSFARANYGTRIKNIDRTIAFDKKKVEKYISLITKLSSLVNSIIIVRPHPEESHDVYKKAFKDLPNIQVIYEGSVIPWIIGADVMIHPDCTTGIESAIMERKAISYLPEHEEGMSAYLPVKLSCSIQDEEQIIDLIISNKYTSRSNIENISFLNEFFSIDKNSMDIIVTTVNEFLRGTQDLKEKHISQLYLIRNRIVEALRLIYHTTFSKPEHKLFKNKLKGLDSHSVAALFATIRTELALDPTITVHELNRNLYRLRKASL